MDINRDDVKWVYPELANEPLVELLRRFKEYVLSDDAPEWQQLIAAAGFVNEVVRLLKWSEYRTLEDRYEEINVMSCDEIRDELMSAVNYHLEVPFEEKLNSMWRDWEFNDTGKYAKFDTIDEMNNFMCDCLEIEYSNLLELEKKYFRIDEE
ncbi:hypothetical protein [Huintestinicola sp.]